MSTVLSPESRTLSFTDWPTLAGQTDQRRSRRRPDRLYCTRLPSLFIAQQCIECKRAPQRPFNRQRPDTVPISLDNWPGQCPPTQLDRRQRRWSVGRSDSEIGMLFVCGLSSRSRACTAVHVRSVRPSIHQHRNFKPITSLVNWAYTQFSGCIALGHPLFKSNFVIRLSKRDLFHPFSG